MLRVGGASPRATGKDGESTIIENGNAADFPVTKLEDDEAGSDNGFRSYTWGAIACEVSNFGDDRPACDTGVMEGDSDSCVVNIDDGVGTAIGSGGSSLSSPRREGLNLEICDRLLSGSGDLVEDGSSLNDGVAVKVAVDGFERGGMV